MTNKELKAKIIAEIERIMAEEMSLFEEQCQGGFEPSPSSPVVYTRMQMLLKFINSLPEEPVSEDNPKMALEKVKYDLMNEKGITVNDYNNPNPIVCIFWEHLAEIITRHFVEKEE